jgi:hypothetical protein
VGFSSFFLFIVHRAAPSGKTIPRATKTLPKPTFVSVRNKLFRGPDSMLTPFGMGCRFCVDNPQFLDFFLGFSLGNFSRDFCGIFPIIVYQVGCKTQQTFNF